MTGETNNLLRRLASRPYPWGPAARVIAKTILVNSAVAFVVWPLVKNTYADLWVSAQVVGFTILAFLLPALKGVRIGWTRVVALAGALVGGAVLGTALVVLIKGRDLSAVLTNPEYFDAFAVTAMMGIAFGGIVSLVMVERARIAIVEKNMLQIEAERQKLARQAAETKLQVLKAQIEPHFLFNTLANLSYLIRKDAEAAVHLLDNLIDYLQIAMPRMRDEESTLGQEVAMCAAFLNIHRIRMGDRLKYCIDVPSALSGFAFPPMMLITLVENAIKHGINPVREGGSLRIGAERDDDTLVVSVSDTGRGLSPAAASGEAFGVGLNNIRERLEALYAGRARWCLVDNPGGGATARIEVPIGQ